MKFKYCLCNSAGWASLLFEDESFSEIYRISYCMGENINELLGGLIALLNHNIETNIKTNIDVLSADFLENVNALLNNDNDINIYTKLIEEYLDENNKFKWIIDQEGSTVELLFSLSDNKKINLKITECYNEKECVYNKELNIIELIDNILESCNEILVKYGIIGYYKNFWIEFPIQNYLLLKNYRKDELVFDYFSETCPHNKVEKMFRSNFNKEIDFLQNK